MLKPSLFLLFVCSAVQLPGLSVVVSGSHLALADGNTPVPSGSFASVGYFADGFAGFSDLPGRSWLDVSSTDYAEVFQPSLVSPGNISGAGSLTGIEGRQLYLWVFAETTAPESIGQSEFGLFTGGSDWLAKGDGLIPFDQNRLLVDSIDRAEYGTVTEHGIALAAIPETAAMAFVLGVGAMALVARRRVRGHSGG